MKLITSPTLGMLDTRYVQGTGVIGQLAEFVTNTKTLQAARILSNVTAGKVLTLTATDDYNLTVPATGIAALLGTANVFTTQQMVDGTSDQIQLRVQGHSTQTANLQTWEKSDGTVVLNISGNGVYTSAITLTDVVANCLGLQEVFNIYATVAENIYTNRGGYFQVNTYGVQNFSNSNGVVGISGEVYHRGSGLVTKMTGLVFGGGIMSSGNVTTFSAMKLSTYGTGAGVIGTYNALEIANISAYHSPTTAYGINIVASTTAIGTSKYGISIGNISGAATNNIAIITNAGDIIFNNGGAALADFTAKTDNYNALFMDASNDSIVIMSNAAGKASLFGVPAIVQPSGAAQAAPAAYVTGAFGLDSDAHMQAFYDLVVAMRTALVGLGAMKGSA